MVDSRATTAPPLARASKTSLEMCSKDLGVEGRAAGADSANKRVTVCLANRVDQKNGMRFIFRFRFFIFHSH